MINEAYLKVGAKSSPFEVRQGVTTLYFLSVKAKSKLWTKLIIRYGSST